MKLFLNFLLPIINYIVLGVSTYFFVKSSRKILRPVKSKILKIIPYVLFFNSLGIQSWIGDENPFIILPFYILVFLICYRGNSISKLVTALLFYILITPINMLIDTIFASYFDEALLGAFLKNQLTLFVKATIFIIISLILYKFIKDENIKLPKNLWYLLLGLLIGPFFVIVGFTGFGVGDLLYPSPSLKSHLFNEEGYSIIRFITLRLSFIIIPFVIISAISIFIAMVILSKQEELKEKENINNMKELYYEGIKNEQKSIRLIKHDMNNYLLTMENMLENNKVEETKEFLKSLTSSSSFNKTRQLTRNEVVNAILDIKINAIKDYNIEFDYEISVPENLEISHVDLSALLGNGLDNAIESTIKSNVKKIKFRLKVEKGLFMLKIENPIGEKPILKDNTFLSTKKNSSNHGFGLTSIREIVSKYRGNMDINMENDKFTLIIIIPLNS
ncbi:sensor histidine kinase [Miniphocaeibacter halophilus]|uniref:GHKL domain-containing protein n=1 Tax=Miniphocaeibacter halophilus TaxID=2931922 RepID=A0AC61MU58_9FIRM|nr:sensor histidine kinase [Miniphocaeibacter halophilus]QQK06923.1 GHKL domain-containing protein [Miniphocaeibacter halophilus]